MSEAKFTPGPWSVSRSGYLVGEGGKKVIAYGVHASFAMASPSAEQRANGYVMNAAGNLYEALEEMMVYFHNGDIPDESHERYAPAAFAIIKQARAALAQARGEAL